MKPVSRTEPHYIIAVMYADIGHRFLFHTAALVSERPVRSVLLHWRVNPAGSNSSSRTMSTDGISGVGIPHRRHHATLAAGTRGNTVVWAARLHVHEKRETAQLLIFVNIHEAPAGCFWTAFLGREPA